MRSGLGLLLALCWPVVIWPSNIAAAAETEPPSAAMLEFLGDLPVDDETWQILEHHALKDVSKKKQAGDE